MGRDFLILDKLGSRWAARALNPGFHEVASHLAHFHRNIRIASNLTKP